MTRKYINKNKSKLAITLSILIHSLLLLSLKSDESLGTTNTPIEFTEIEMMIGQGESIQNSKFSQIKKKQTNIPEQQKRKKSDTENITKSISNIKIDSKTKNKKVKTNKQNSDTQKREIKESAKSQKESILGNKSNKKINENLKGKLKGKGSKKIICRKCFEPIYSQQSIRKGKEGITTVKVTIDTNGMVKNAVIIRSSGHKDIDKASIKAAIKSTFKPISDQTIINIIYEHKIKK